MTPTEPAARRPLLRRAVRFALPLAIVVAAFIVAGRLLDTAPQAPRMPAQERQARLVEVHTVTAADTAIALEAGGTVIAARSASLRARVSGEIVATGEAFVPGGRFAAGDLLLTLDRRDYELALDQQRAAVARAEAALRLEQASQTVARREYEVLGEEIPEADRGLVLREPQIRQIEADLMSAQSLLASATLDLQRTEVRAPFDGIVVSRQASLGDQADPSQTLATLAATDEYWISVPVPVGQLRWVDLPDTSPDGRGSAVRVRYADAWGANASRDGHVLRLEGALEEDGRMARLLVAVPDPLGLQGDGLQALLLGAYVSVGIEGRTVPGAVALPSSLVQADGTVRVITPENRLEIRPVTVLHRDRERAVIGDGLRAGERVVVTSLTGAVEGMPLRVEEDPPADAGAAAAGSVR